MHGSPTENIVKYSSTLVTIMQVGHPGQENENMSSDRIGLTGLDSSHRPGDDDDRVEAIIESLNARVTAFEQNLESAVLAETQFRSNIQTLLDSLNTFVERHVEKDRRLTQLIEQDTQRSKEAKEEYDALASRFDGNLRRDSLTRTRDWLRTVSVYVGIVISLVLMAPLHALWWLFTGTLSRIGLLKPSEGTRVYVGVRRRGRDETRKAASSNRQALATRHQRHASAKNGTVFSEGVSPVASSASRRKEETMDGADIQDDRNLKDTNNASDPADYASSPLYSDDIVSNGIRETRAPSRFGATHKAQSSESEEEFFDAQNGSEEPTSYSRETQPTEEEQIEQEDDDITTSHGDTHRRPGWAVPAGSDETFPDLSAFPSSDFWEISDDDIRLEVQEPDQASS